MCLRILFITGFIFSVGTTVIKREGETVTLHVNSTGHQLKNFLWTFGPAHPVKAISIVTNGEVTRVNGTRFDGRLHTDVETGSITISNLTVNDTGVFLIQIFKETGTFLEKFNLTVQENGIPPINALEGSNVTLYSGLHNLQKDHNVMWTRGPNFSGYLIAQWQNSIITIIESFKDILQLDPVNGNLTFLRVTTNLTGFYCVKILKGHDSHILRQYHLTAYEPVSVPNITTAQTNITPEPRSNEVCDVSCSVKNGLDVNLTLYEGEEIIKQTSNSNISISLVIPVELHREKETIYSLTANNPVSTETISINSTQWCPPHGSDLNIGAITGGVLGLLCVVAVIVYLNCGRRNQGTTTVCLQMDQRDSAQNNSQETVQALLDDDDGQHYGAAAGDLNPPSSPPNTRPPPSPPPNN